MDPDPLLDIRPTMQRTPAATAPVFSRPRAIHVLPALGATLLASLYLELLGWRIVHPGIALGEAWSGRFLLGALRTAGGATVAGLLLAGPGAVLRYRRVWPRAPLLLLWSIGAAAFLSAVAGLVAWAP